MGAFRLGRLRKHPTNVTITAEKIARNDSAFRDANETIESVAEGQVAEPGRLVPFICECSDAACVDIVRLTLAEYRHVRSYPSWFVHALGHETDIEGAVTLRERHERYVVVEKIGRAGAVAAQLARRPSQEGDDDGGESATEG